MWYCCIVDPSVPLNAMSNLASGGGGCNLPSNKPPDGVQPLPSNVIHKQPPTLEAQYMQQQSCIHVFDTQLANKAAEAVVSDAIASILMFHQCQPATKKFMEVCGRPMDLMTFFISILRATIWYKFEVCSSTGSGDMGQNMCFGVSRTTFPGTKNCRSLKTGQKIQKILTVTPLKIKFWF